jgi:peptidyl-prolyl cis-trans isomerase B (cyclophilin B)
MKPVLFGTLWMMFTLSACANPSSSGLDTGDAQQGLVSGAPASTSTHSPATSGSAAEPAPMDTTATKYYRISTPAGDMVIMLHNETPLHRDNFDKLAREGFYDGTTFHRIINGFMVQGGDPNSKDDDPTNDGMGGPGYTVPAEFNRSLIHRKGAIAAARTGDQMNPERRSSGSQFYIVHGQAFDAMQMQQIERTVQQAIGDPSFIYTAEERATLMTDGGAPFLDMQYTVFGQVVEGFDVLDMIAAAPTATSTRQRPIAPGTNDRPFEDVTMTVTPLDDYTPAP